MPAVGVIAIGSRSGWMVPVPLPLFVIWPLVTIALGVTRLALWVRRGRPSPSLLLVQVALLAFFRLHGLKIDVRSRDGKRVLVWLL